MSSLGGARVALFETRRSAELASLVQRHGGEPITVPAVREVTRPLDPARERAITRLATGEFDIIVCLTGVGVERLLDAAERISCREALLDAMRAATVVCRGPKPIAVLKRLDVPIAASAASPYTATKLLTALESIPLAGAMVAVSNAGEPNPVLTDGIRAREPREILEVQLYDYSLPAADLEHLQTLVRRVIAGEVDCLAFTSQIQVRHVMLAAESAGLLDAFTTALGGPIVTAVVGPTCAEVLRTYGVTSYIAPDHPKMGQMVLALAAEVETRSRAR